MFPRLDVDFHLAPFVDPRDHGGVAAARVTIGAPHFETPREFWVRPVRWIDSKDFAYANLLMRPVEAEKARLIIANFAFKHPPEQEHLEIPANWLEGRINNHNGQAHTLFSSCSRFWHEPERDVRVAWQGFKNPVFCEGVTLHLNLKWLPNPYAEPRRFLLDEFVDWPTTEFHDFLRYQLNDTSSQLCLTWKWSHLSRGEQRRLFFALPRWKKLPVLLKSVLQNEAIFNPLIAQSGADINLYSSYDRLRIRSSPGQMQATTSRMRSWASAICCYLDKVEADNPVPALIKYVHLGVLNVNCPAPTHHEMLEARLTLHAWARENLPPSQAAELIALDDLN